MNPQELFANLEQKYKLPQGYLARVYQVESSGGKNVYNEESGAEGPFQFMPRTSRVVGLKNPYDLAESADAAARLAVQNRAYLQKKGIEEVDGRTLYLAHAQGAAGAHRLLSNPEQPATALVGEKAVTQNAGKKGQPSAEFAEQLMNRYEQPARKSEPYSALGTSEPIPEQALKDAAASAVMEAPEADRTSDRRRTSALNTLMSLTRDMQAEPEAPKLLPIPRLSYADGGIVGLVKDKDDAGTEDIDVKAMEDGCPNSGARVADSKEDFRTALKFWTTDPGYKKLNPRTVEWRLVPAYQNGRLLMLCNEGRTEGVAVWGWMTDAEYATQKYSGKEVFSRKSGDKLVVTDIFSNVNVTRFARQMGRYFRKLYPDLSVVHGHRGHGQRPARYYI
jgi:hemolysin-activating ACP:hemolysin acyltransferase